MSSRIPYQSPEFEQASMNPQTLATWEQQQFKQAQDKCRQQTTVNDLLLCAELALRNQDLVCTTDCLDKAIKLKPTEADAYLLKAWSLMAQQQTPAAVAYLQENLKKSTGKTPDAARLYRVLAGLLLSEQNNLLQAVKVFKEGLDLLGTFSCFHATTRPLETVTLPNFEFDCQLFDHLYNWENEPATTCFGAVATGLNDEIYVLERQNNWLFQLNAQGQLIQGLTEKHLARVDFLHPENRWQLNDVCCDSQGRVWVAGCQDALYCFNREWQCVQTIPSPEPGERLGLQSIAVDNQGRIYALYRNHKGIFQFAPEGHLIANFGANTTMPGSDRNYYCGLAVNSEGVLCLFDRLNVQHFNPDAHDVIETLEVPDSNSDDFEATDFPLCWNGIAHDHQGYTYLANTYQENIVVLDPQGNSLEMIDRLDQKLQVLSHPNDVALDSQRNLIVADTGGARIVKRQGNRWSVMLAHPNWKSAIPLSNPQG